MDLKSINYRLTDYKSAKTKIAKGLSPFQPEKVAIEAGRIMLKRIQELLNAQSDFAFETTLASKSYVNTFKEAHSKG